MAKNAIFRSSDHQIREIIFQVLGLLCLTILVRQNSCEANNFSIGGSKGWRVPDDPNAPHYDQWAENNRFQIGDSIVFDYPADNDSVLVVNQDDYNNCNIANPLHKFNDGHTVYTFQESGPHYFISGNKDNCLKNEKVIVIVLAERNHTNSPSPSPGTTSPPPSNSTESTPPSPAPASQEAPSPPAGTVGISPLSPVSEPSPPNSAASFYMSFLGCIGALVASSLVI